MISNKYKINMNRIFRLITLVSLLLNSTSLLFSQNINSNTRVNNLAPSYRLNSLDIAKSQLNTLKREQGKDAYLFAIVPSKLVMRNIHLEIGKIFTENKLHHRSFQDRVEFIQDIFSLQGFIQSEKNSLSLKNWEKVGKEIKIAIDQVVANSSQFLDAKGYLNPKGREFFKELENRHLSHQSLTGDFFSFEDNVDFNIAVNWFLLILGKDSDAKYTELYALQQEALLEQLIKEHNQKGSGQFREIIFITDIHAGNDRLFPIVAHSFGLESEDYDGLETLEQLIQVLYKNGILDNNYNIKSEYKKKIRFKGFSDMPDRGDRYLEVHDCAKWLQDQNMLDHISGNHEQGLVNGITEIHLMERFKGMATVDPVNNIVKYNSTEGKGDHITYWSYEMVTHAGWVTNTIDEINEQRFNLLFQGLNETFGFDFELVDLINFRENGPAVWMKELKKRNNVIREGDKYFDTDCYAPNLNHNYYQI